MEPTEEREFWEWCGVTFKPHLSSRGTEYETTEIIVYPDGNEYIQYKGEFPNLDLNNLFQYAVPQLDGYMMFTSSDGIHFIASKYGLNYEFVADKEEDAIYGALWKVKEEQE